MKLPAKKKLHIYVILYTYVYIIHIYIYVYLHIHTYLLVDEDDDMGFDLSWSFRIVDHGGSWWSPSQFSARWNWWNPVGQPLLPKKTMARPSHSQKGTGIRWHISGSTSVKMASLLGGCTINVGLASTYHSCRRTHAGHMAFQENKNWNSHRKNADSSFFFRFRLAA